VLIFGREVQGEGGEGIGTRCPGAIDSFLRVRRPCDVEDCRKTWEHEQSSDVMWKVP